MPDPPPEVFNQDISAILVYVGNCIYSPVGKDVDFRAGTATWADRLAVFSKLQLWTEIWLWAVRERAPDAMGPADGIILV